MSTLSRVFSVIFRLLDAAAISFIAMTIVVVLAATLVIGGLKVKMTCTQPNIFDPWARCIVESEVVSAEIGFAFIPASK